jgi:hypothetical protein
MYVGRAYDQDCMTSTWQFTDFQWGHRNPCTSSSSLHTFVNKVAVHVRTSASIRPRSSGKGVGGQWWNVKHNLLCILRRDEIKWCKVKRSRPPSDRCLSVSVETFDLRSPEMQRKNVEILCSLLPLGPCSSRRGVRKTSNMSRCSISDTVHSAKEKGPNTFCFDKATDSLKDGLSLVRLLITASE